MLDKLIELEGRFQQYLQPGDYTFIGPVDQDLWEDVRRRATGLLPFGVIVPDYHFVLSNKEVIHQALRTLPADTPLRVYVVNRTYAGNLLMWKTLESYCKKNSIDDFQQ